VLRRQVAIDDEHGTGGWRRPIYHKCDETIRGHVFCSFVALVLRKELQDRLERRGWSLE
jgi:hypothetical protein